jgi:hypothetical protein
MSRTAHFRPRPAAHGPGPGLSRIAQEGPVPSRPATNNLTGTELAASSRSELGVASIINGDNIYER